MTSQDSNASMALASHGKLSTGSPKKLNMMAPVRGRVVEGFRVRMISIRFKF
jgi:hypothetical protein